MSEERPFNVTEHLAYREAIRGRSGPRGNQGGPMGAIFNIFPLILIPVLIYNIWAFGSTAVGTTGADVREHLRNDVFLRVPMASQEANAAGVMQSVEWVLSFGDLMVLIALILLFIELLKSTSTGTTAIFNHALSMLVFIVCLVEFLLHPAFATSVFFLIMIMALLDVLAGVVVTIISARRDVEFGGGQH